MRYAVIRRKPSSKVPQVALLIETSTQYGRGLLRGIIRYSKLHGPWSLDIAPGHLHQAFPVAGAWRGDGIIARIRSPRMLESLRDIGVPYVASDLSECPTQLGEKSCGQIRTDGESIGRLGAAYLIERGLRHFAICGFSRVQWSARSRLT